MADPRILTESRCQRRSLAQADLCRNRPARRATDLLLARIGLLAEAVDNPPVQFVTVTAQNL
jgi:hypothetical protein